MNEIGYIKMTNNIKLILYDDIKINFSSLKPTRVHDQIDLLVQEINSNKRHLIRIETNKQKYFLNTSHIIFISKNDNNSIDK